MDIEALNKRLAELYGFRNHLEVQMVTLNGHIEEIKHLIHELSKPKDEEKQDGEANSQEPEQAA